MAASPMELELQSKLAAVQAELRALQEKHVVQEKGSVDMDRDSLYRRMDAELWDHSLLAQDCFFQKLSVRICAF